MMMCEYDLGRPGVTACMNRVVLRVSVPVSSTRHDIYIYSYVNA